MATGWAKIVSDVTYGDILVTQRHSPDEAQAFHMTITIVRDDLVTFHFTSRLPDKASRDALYASPSTAIAQAKTGVKGA